MKGHSGVYERTPEIKKGLKGHCGVYERTEGHNKNNREGQLKRYQDPKAREKLSKYMIEKYKDSKEREKQSRIMIMVMNKPEVRKKCSKSQLKRYEDPREREKTSRAMKVVANRPEVKAKLKEAATKNWQNPVFREKVIKAIKIVRSKPESKEKSSKETTKSWQIPVFREKVTKAVKIARNRPEFKLKISKSNMRNWQNPEFREETTEALKRAWEKRAESSGYPRNYLCPNFNFGSIIIFKMLDKVLHTGSRFGGTKAGEKKIGRYFVDCFNKEYKFIIEWDENSHYDFDDYLKEYDIKKRKYILAKYPDYAYIIIKQDRWFDNGGLTNQVVTKITDYILGKLKITEEVTNWRED